MLLTVRGCIIYKWKTLCHFKTHTSNMTILCSWRWAFKCLFIISGKASHEGKLLSSTVYSSLKTPLEVRNSVMCVISVFVYVYVFVCESSIQISESASRS